MSHRQPHLTARLQGFGTTVFTEMTALAEQHGAINLGQGFPDTDPPEQVAEAAQQAIRDGHNQYAPGPGVPALREAVAEHQARFHGLTYDPDREVTVTFGATESLSASLLALCDVGDEVVLLEPAYDAYVAGVAMAGAIPRMVPLRLPDFSVDADALAAVMGPRTKAIVVNSPHNPSGAVLGPDSLDAIAAACRAHDVVAVSDEVYEHLRYDAPHAPLAAREGMRERTITISSGAKTFSATGWKTGWACAPPELTTAVRTAKQFMTFAGGTPFQHAIAAGLRLPEAFFDELAAEHAARRDLLVEGLEQAGLPTLPSHGSYFVLADISALGYTDDVAFCRALPEQIGVVAVPCSAFVWVPGGPRHLVRFAFCKRREVLAEAAERLAGLSSRSDA